MYVNHCEQQIECSSKSEHPCEKAGEIEHNDDLRS